ncbi:MAG: anthranilate synthase component I family protein [Planctomycetota bacterium]|jgi:para-aminobenzoate synthetase component 1
MTTGAVAANRRTVPCKLHHKRIRISADLAALSEIFADLESPSILGGNISKKDADRFSCWAAGPKEVLEFRTGEQEPFAKLQEALSRYKLDEGHEEDLPTGIFCGGWIGYFSYELGRHIERLPETTIDDVKMPLIRLCFYDRVVCYDHIEKDFWLIALELPDDAEKPGDKLAGLEQLLSKAREVSVTVPLADDIESVDFSNIRCNMDKDYYLQAIEKIKRYIYDGDVYQINFSQRFECDYKARPIELFHWQNYYNPSPYAAYIDGGSFHIVSASPEMFATIQDGAISTKPIKGTRPRVNENSGKDRQANSSNFDELVNSEKEQAELNMIVDLERNDVARICEPGTRTVIQPRTIESYPTVFHAVATVAGKLKSEASFCDILRAMFPGGSITGAPKIRSMEIIDETEPTARGVYTGSIGYIGIDGSVCLNIAIRTIIIADKKAFAQTGGGIVADSDPQDEWDETITKARALLAGIISTNREARI